MFRQAMFGVLAVGLAACGPALEGECEDCGLQVDFTFTDAELATHQAINDYRAQQGLKALELDPALGALAREHSANMAAGTVEFGHDGFDARAGVAFGELGYGAFGENVYLKRRVRGPRCRGGPRLAR